MAFCINCGKELQDSFEFCPECGMEISSEGKESHDPKESFDNFAGKTKIYQKCGEAMPEDFFTA